MQIDKCRVCGRNFFEEPFLRYENMPKAAQFFPSPSSLKDDRGVCMKIFQCSGCGLVQLSNDPVPHYKEVIRASAISDDMKNFRKKQFLEFVQKFSLKGKKVIEIGCGGGEYLSIMQQCGADAYGLEYRAESVAQCTRNGLKVSKGFIEDSDVRLDNGPFDAFFILNFLEHVPDPNSVLRGAYNNLTDDGVGIVEVPNFDTALRNNLFYDFICDHLTYFTQETLNTLLRLNGFEVVSCGESLREFVISAAVRKRKKLNPVPFHKSQTQLKNEIKEYINRFKDKKVAIWGAGHQALALISLIDLADKIRYIIDSAPFKQGRYSPATHIPIVSSESIKFDQVDAIIVMAGSYSDEVAKIIRQKFGPTIAVAILRNCGLEEV